MLRYLRYGTQCSIMVITALMTLHFAPQSWRVSGICAIFLGLLVAELVDACFSFKPFWKATSKADSCSCSEVVQKVAKLPGLLYSQCGKCGAGMA